MIKFEIITSNTKTVSTTFETVEYEFKGDFRNLISAIPIDLIGPSLETVAISYNKNVLFVTAKNVENIQQPETAHLYIVKLNSLN